MSLVTVYKVSIEWGEGGMGNQISSGENIHVKREKEVTVQDGRRFGVSFVT